MSSSYDSKRILVTGATGFLVSHLCERLVNQGHEVLGVENSLPGGAPTSLICSNAQILN